MSQDIIPWGSEGSQYQDYGPGPWPDDDQAAYDPDPDELPTRDDLLWEVRGVNSLLAYGFLSPAQGSAILHGYKIQLNALSDNPPAEQGADEEETWKLAEVCREHTEYYESFAHRFNHHQQQWIFEAMGDEGWDHREGCDGAAEVPERADGGEGGHEGEGSGSSEGSG